MYGRDYSFNTVSMPYLRQRRTTRTGGVITYCSLVFTDLNSIKVNFLTIRSSPPGFPFLMQAFVLRQDFENTLVWFGIFWWFFRSIRRSAYASCKSNVSSLCSIHGGWIRSACRNGIGESKVFAQHVIVVQIGAIFIAFSSKFPLRCLH